MTMHTSDSEQSGFLHSTAGQMTVTVIVLIVVLLLAWRYVF